MRSNFILILSGVCLVLFAGITCKPKHREKKFTHDKEGYYYQLLSFDSDTSYQDKKVAWITATFKTQSDSVFWDSFNNLNDRFFLQNDSSEKDNFLKRYISKCSASDSACLLIKTNDFFRQQFKAKGIPFFSKNDSVVRVNFKIKQLLSHDDFVKIRTDLRKREEEKIEKYYGTFAEAEAAQDPLGFYWVDRSGVATGPSPKQGDRVTISYRGEYINGRFLEKSSSDFEFIYGTPDQLLKGLNYVIGRLKLGENAKIILPSRLAFGENGSSNGTVPPYTPLVYEIKLIDLNPGEHLHD